MEQKQDGGRKRYSVKLKNLNFNLVPNQDQKKDIMTSEVLWHSLRNDIAHRYRKPTFKETYESLYFLVRFIQEMPNVLQEWENNNFLVSS